MSTNLVNYEVMENGKTVYATQSQAIVDVMSALATMNSELENGWQNETARAFIQKYETVYAKNLQIVAEELADISTYINNYAQKRKEEDAAGASAIG